MNKSIRYPFMLIATLVGSAFFHSVSASPTQLPRYYYQPNYLPAMPAGNAVGFTPSYRFRPIERHRVGNPYRLSAVPGFGGYHGAAGRASHAYPPRYRPARFYAPHFVDNNSWQTQGYTLPPRTGYFRANNFRYPRGYPQGMWRRPPALAANPEFIQRGYVQPRVPGLGLVWSGRQPNYYGRFRPLPSSRMAPPGQFTANWGRQLPAYQRTVPQTRFAPVFPPMPQQAPMGLAYSVPVYAGWRKNADNSLYPNRRVLRHAPVDRRFIHSQDQYRFSNLNFRHEKITVPPPRSFASAFPVPNSAYIRSGNRHYRFRPDNRIAESQKPVSAVSREDLIPKRTMDQSVPSPSVDYRFRPDNRFSGMLPTVPRRLLPLFSASPKPETAENLSGDLREFSEMEIRPLPSDLKDPADVADPFEISLLDIDPPRFSGIDEFQSIADYINGR